MKKTLLNHLRLTIVGMCAIFVMLLVSACSGVAGSNGSASGTITGSVVAVSAANRSVTLNVNGQQITVNGLTDQQVTAIQSQVGKTYTINVQAAQTGTNTYAISAGTEPTETDNATPEVNVTNTETDNNTATNGTNEPGNINFIGKVQSSNGSSLVAIMPGNQTLTMNIVNGQTEIKNLNVNQLNGQTIKVTAVANADGSFMASKLEATDSGDLQDTVKLNTLDLQGVTTQAVGANNTIKVKVGNKVYTFTLSATTQLKDFANAQAIAANQNVKLEVLFNGSNANVQKVENGNG